MTELTYRNAQKMIAVLVDLRDEASRFMDRYGNTFLNNSQASREFEAFADQQSVKTVFAQGAIQIEVAADHLMALKKVLSEPAQTIAPWSCARSVLESSAISAWLFDPEITIIERVQRSFAFRFEGLQQQSKLGNAINATTKVAKVKTRIDDVEQKALGLGFSRVLDKRGRRIGIGQQMPSITTLISLILNEEASYRLLSALAHAHPWALQQASFRVSSDERGLFAEKDLSVISIAFLCTLGARSFARSIWYKTLLFGWDIEQMSEILQQILDDFPIPPEEQFWRIS